MAFATIGTTGIADDAVTSAKVAPGVVDTEAQPNQAPIIINGNMAVAQRGTSATGKTDGAYFTCDRMTCGIGNIGTYTITQESLTSGNAFNNGFANAWRIDCTTADGSPAAGDFLWAEMNLEGQDLQLFKKGTSNAEKFTLAFWVKSNKTGTSQVNLRDRDNSRMCSGTYAISSADTWEHKVVNIAADTTGAFGNDNGKSLTIEWWLGAGSTYSGGTIPTAWEARADGDRGVSTLGINDNTANDWAITGVQLEVGEFTSSTIPPFKHETFAENKKRCARYYYKVAEYGADGLTYQTIGTGNYKSTSQWRVLCYLPVRPRTNPSLDSTSGTNYYINDLSGIDDTFNSFTLTRNNADIVQVIHNASEVSGTVGQAGETVAYASGSYVAFDAEL